MDDSRKKIAKIKIGAAARTFALARLSAKAGAKAAGHALGTLFLPEKEKAGRRDSLLREQAELLARELGQLKGSVMKAGQMLSVLGEQFFPSEVNAILKSLQSQSPPLAWPAIEKVLRQQLGENLGELEIEREPIAAASLGQVYRARAKASGAQLAVKVQYPGVDKAIDGDIAALRSVLALCRILPNHERIDDLFAEVKQMLRQEVDYGRELGETQRYFDLLKDDPRFVVPRPLGDLSTHRVLTTEYQEGVPVDGAEVRALPQHRRDRIAHAILELHFRELFEWKSVQTDPHFGNYKIQVDEEGENDRIVLLDFGAVRRFPRSFLEPYGEMIRGIVEGNPQLLERGAMGIGFLSPAAPEDYRAAFRNFCFLFGEPFQGSGSYHWKDSDLPRRIAKAGGRLALSMKFRVPPRELVFLDRKMAGVFILMSTLGAGINGRGIVEKYVSPERIGD